jgi:hypothetical protein
MATFQLPGGTWVTPPFQSLVGVFHHRTWASRVSALHSSPWSALPLSLSLLWSACSFPLSSRKRVTFAVSVARRTKGIGSEASLSLVGVIVFMLLRRVKGVCDHAWIIAGECRASEGNRTTFTAGECQNCQCGEIRSCCQGVMAGQDGGPSRQHRKQQRENSGPMALGGVRAAGNSNCRDCLRDHAARLKGRE